MTLPIWDIQWKNRSSAVEELTETAGQYLRKQIHYALFVFSTHVNLFFHKSLCLILLFTFSIFTKIHFRAWKGRLIRRCRFDLREEQGLQSPMCKDRTMPVSIWNCRNNNDMIPCLYIWLMSTQKFITSYAYAVLNKRGFWYSRANYKLVV